MKKAILILVWFSFLCTNDIFPIIHPEIKAESSKLVKLKNAAAFAYRTVNSNIDFLLTAKGALKTLVVFSPILILYCHYFDYNPTKSLINKIINLIGYAKETYRIQADLGKADAYLEFISDAPEKSLRIMLSNFIDKIINSGIPFIGGLFATRLISKAK